MTVTGTGETTAAPDHAVVRLGATAQAEEAAAAQISVNEVMQKALAEIERIGIVRRSIRTSGLTLMPIYAPQKPDRAIEPRVVAYRAGNTIEVIVEDTKLVGKVIDAGLGAGANRLEGVSFGLRNDLPQRTAALRAAVDEARTKAQTIARALDVPLGSVREVIEGGVQVFRPERFATARGMMADAMQTPVEPGEVRVQASVTIHYDIGSPK
ncbi:MAG TPA: SIMPL domain-containing protein [Methylomirabilota bacterium]|nr:SIMPL domain-containing protein [Methylomirabilota bacterium]